MFKHPVAATVTAGSFIFFLLTQAANVIAIAHLPTDLREALTAMSHVPTLLAWGILAVGIALLVYLVVERLKKPETPAAPSMMPMPAPSTLVDSRSIELAGIVNSLMETATSYSFRLPLHESDPVVQRWNDIKSSAHPIWTNKQINQLRRDFLQFIGIVGDQQTRAREKQADREKLREYGDQLIARLKGEQFISTLEWRPIYEVIAHVAKSIGDSDAKQCCEVVPVV